MSPALALAALSAACFGAALVTARLGLQDADARRGAAISVPSAALLFLLGAPFAVDLARFDAGAALIFAAVGLFFPALVTLLSFRSNERLGPTVTGAVAGTAPLFALAAAVLVVGEPVPQRAPLACLGVALGVALISWDHASLRRGVPLAALGWPVGGALVRGCSQAAAKAGLAIWPDAFAAGAIGYAVSAAVLLGTRPRHRGAPPLPRRGVAWFAATGVLNGSAVLAMYLALARAPVSTVAPVVATHPLLAALLGAIFLRERPGRRTAAGALLAVAAVVYLVSG